MRAAVLPRNNPFGRFVRPAEEQARSRGKVANTASQLTSAAGLAKTLLLKPTSPARRVHALHALLTSRVLRAGGDRLSALPDELLHSIMSFLMARQIVQTGVLSRRWRHLWRSTPNLFIDYREFATDATASGGGAVTSGYTAPPIQQVTWRNLVEFVSNLLKSHDAPVLDRFQLRVGASYLPGGSSTVNSWIRCGTNRYRPAVLEITVEDSDVYRQWFTPSLVPATSSRLTRMHLRRVRLDRGFAEHLQSGCPVLEYLVLAGCDCVFQEIFSSTLKSLVIDCCHSPSSSVFVSRTVTAPALASFRLVLLKKARQDALLVNGGAAGGGQASITFSCGDFGFVERNMFKLLGSLCNVTTLELWRFGYQHLMYRKEEFPELPNLTTLVMGKCEMSKQFGLLRFFVKNIPSLEKIILKQCKYSTEYTKKFAQEYAKRYPRYRKLLCYDHHDLKLIGIKYKETSTSYLFGLMMAIRTKLEDDYTIVLSKVKYSDFLKKELLWEGNDNIEGPTILTRGRS